MEIAVWSNLWHRKLFKGFSFIDGTLSEDVMASYDLFKKCRKLAIVPRSSGYHWTVRIGSVSRSSLKVGDYAAVEHTTSVANDVREFAPKAYPAALLHTYKAMFNIINKAFLFGFDKELDQQAFYNKKKGFLRY